MNAIKIQQFYRRYRSFQLFKEQERLKLLAIKHEQEGKKEKIFTLPIPVDSAYAPRTSTGQLDMTFTQSGFIDKTSISASSSVPNVARGTTTKNLWFKAVRQITAMQSLQNIQESIRRQNEESNDLDKLIERLEANTKDL